MPEIVLIPENIAPNNESPYGGLYGNKFRLPEPYEITHYQYYQDAEDTSGPQGLRLIDEPTGAIIDTKGAQALGTPGWNRVALSAPVTIVANRTYFVGYVANNTLAFQVRGFTPMPGGIGGGGQLLGDFIGGNTNAIGGAAGWDAAAVGVVIGGTTGPVPPADPPDEEPDPGTVDPGGSLAYWLHQATENPDSLPKLIYGLLQTVQGAITSIAGHAGKIGDFPISFKNIPKASIAAFLFDLGMSIWSQEQEQEAQAQVLTTINDRTSQLQDDILGITGTVGNRGIREDSSIAAPGWSVAGGGGGAGHFTITVPADRYILELTNWGENRVVNELAGVPFHTQPFWWCPLDGDIAGEYRTFRSVKTELRIPGRSLVGAFVSLPPDVEYQWTGYTYTG